MRADATDDIASQRLDGREVSETVIRPRSGRRLLELDEIWRYSTTARL